MKSTEHFQKVIEARLQEMAAADPLFAVNLKKEHKNIEGCITYILTTVQLSGCSGFADDEIFGMAAHYYDEDDIVVKTSGQCKVVINHSIDLSEEEKAQVKKAAIDKAINEEREKLRRKSIPKNSTPVVNQQASLF